jgi:hypothetical protein
MSSRFYLPFKQWQKFKGSGTVNTHRGVAPTRGSWLIPHYAADSNVRDAFFKQLVQLQEAGVPYAVMENIDSLAADALTRVRIDLDVDLPTDDAAAFQPHFAAFVDTLYDILYEYTELTVDCEITGTVVLLEKPRCTARDRGGFKHGAKLTMPYLVATHRDMLQLRVLLLQHADRWMPASWHGNTPALETSIIDPCVYKCNGWLMYGSRKEEQLHGGYTATLVWHSKGDASPMADCDWTLLDLQRMLSIFCDHERNDDVQTLQWVKVPPGVEQHRSKRRREVHAAPTERRQADISAPVLSILTEILAGVGDTTSTLTYESTGQDMYRYRVSRHGRMTACANKQEHRGNSSILQLTTLCGRPVVKYICFSSKCGEGRTPIVLKCPALAKRWATAETSHKRPRTEDTASVAAVSENALDSTAGNAAADCVTDDTPDILQDEPEWYAGDTPAMLEEVPEWYAGELPDMPPEEEEPDWYAGDSPAMPEEEPDWYADNAPAMPAEKHARTAPVRACKTAIVDADPPRTEKGYMGPLLDLKNKFISVMIAMNGGKSYGAIELAKANKDWTIWFVTARQSHAYALLETILKADLDCAMYLKKDWMDKLKSRIKIVQYQSLFSKLKRCPLPHMVVMDETKALADAIQCVSTNQDNLMLNWMFMKDVIHNALKVLYLDADMCHDGAAYALQDVLFKHCRTTTIERLAHDADALQAFAAQPVEQQKILRREYPVSKYDMQRKLKLATGPQQWKLLVQDLVAGRRVLVVCGSSKEAAVLSKRVAEFVTGELRVGLYTSETDNNADLQHLTRCWDMYQIIIISSTITIGLDYQKLLHRVYVLPHTLSSTPQQAWQGTGRCRMCSAGEIVVRWDGDDAQLRAITKAEIERKVKEQLEFYVERKGIVETSVRGEKTRLSFTLERQLLDGQVGTVCCDMLTLMAHSKVERSYCHSDSEWLSYFLCIGKRKGIPIADLGFDDVDGEHSDDDGAVAAEAKEALHAEGAYRAEIFDKMSVDGLPMYSVQKLIDATAALQQYTPEEIQSARVHEQARFTSNLHLPQDEQKKHAQDYRAETPALDAALTHAEICEDARQLNRILRFERTGHGEAKEVFMRDQSEARGSDFGEHDLKLLCTKLLMTKMFPGTAITHTFVKRFEKHRLAVTNQIRLIQDDGVVSVASAADFLLRTRDSDRIDTMQQMHLLLKKAEKMVLSLGFTGLRDFETAIPESSLTLQKTQRTARAALARCNCSKGKACRQQKELKETAERQDKTLQHTECSRRVDAADKEGQWLQAEESAEC